MKKILLGALLFCFTVQVNGQEYNKWSVDLAGGVHQITSSLSPGYSTGFTALGQANLGLRYMANEKFGVLLDIGYNEFQEGDNSLPFRANYYRASLQGVVNAGNLLKFSTWTNKFNLLLHSGFGLSTIKTLTPIAQSGESVMNYIIGVSPQYKLSNRVSLFLDVTGILHNQQNNNYDGAVNLDKRGISTSIVNSSIGVSISIGKNKENADFIKNDEVLVNNELAEIKTRLEKTENVIADLLIMRDTEVNKVALVKELDTRYAKKDEVLTSKYANTVTSSNVNFIKELLNSGYINVFFDVNKKTVQEGSLNSVNYLIQFMNDNPSVSALLIGFADETGKENQNLALSKDRAKSVFDILVSAGISTSRLSYTGGGEDKSFTEKGRQFARKVTFQIN